MSVYMRIKDNPPVKQSWILTHIMGFSTHQAEQHSFNIKPNEEQTKNVWLQWLVQQKNMFN